MSQVVSQSVSEGGREGGPTCPLFVGQSFWNLHKQPCLLRPQGVWQVGSKGDQATPIHHLTGGREGGREGGRKGEEGREGERGREGREGREGWRNIK